MESVGVFSLCVLLLVAFWLLAAFSIFICAGTNDKKFLRLMLGYSGVVSIAITLSLYSSLNTAMMGVPNLLGDGVGYYSQALQLKDQGLLNFSEVRSNYFGYQLFIATIFRVFGEHLFVGLLANAFILLATVAVLYRAIYVLTRRRSVAFYGSLAFMLTPQMIYYAILLLKDPAIILAFAMVMLALARLVRRDGVDGSAMLILIVALVLLAALRGAFLFFIIAESALFILLYLRRRSYLVLLVGLLAVAMIPLATSMTTRSLDSTYIAATVLDNEVISSKLESGEVDTGGVVGTVSGLYLSLPFLVRIVLFGVPTLLQYLTPFNFWSGAFVSEHYALLFSRNLNPIWFMFVGVWMLFALVNLRRLEDSYLKHFLIIGVAFYVLIAVMYGGAIPRYAAPALVFIYPTIGYWWAAVREDSTVKRRAMRFFGTCYAGFLAAGIAYVLFKLMRVF